MTPAHLHLMLNHIPILGPMLVLVLLAWGMARRDWSYSRLALIFTIFVGIVSIPVYVSGEPAEHALEDIRPLPESAVEAHEEAAVWAFVGLEALALFAAAVLWKARNGQAPSRAVLTTFTAVTLVVTGATVRTAYLGGQITHAELAPGTPASSPQWRSGTANRQAAGGVSEPSSLKGKNPKYPRNDSEGHRARGDLVHPARSTSRCGQ